MQAENVQNLALCYPVYHLQCCGSGIRCLFDRFIRDPECVKIRIRDENPDHFSESLVTIFWVKIPKFFDADPGFGIFLTLDPGWEKFVSGIRHKHPGSATLIIWICCLDDRSTTRTTSTRGMRYSSGRRCTLPSAGPPSSKVLAGKPRSSRLGLESGI
jgi:hypothetical protein